MAGTDVSIRVSLESLMAAIEALPIADKHAIFAALHQTLELADEDAWEAMPESKAELAEAERSLAAGEGVDLDEYLRKRRESA